MTRIRFNPTARRLASRTGKAAAAMLTSLLTACAWQPEPLPETTPPPDFVTAQQLVPRLRESPVDSHWWAGFGSDRLEQVLRSLEASSFDLAIARARIDRARALTGAQRRDNWPSANARVQRRAAHNFDTEATSNSDGAGFSAAYEVDLWGIRAAANRSARLNLALAEYDFQATALTYKALAAEAYVSWLAAGERLAIAEQNLAASADLLRLIELRFEAGSASGIELDQQRNTLLATRAQALSLAREVQTRERALAALLGESSLRLPPPDERFADLQVPAVASLQPAQLLENRPDVQLAEIQLRLADASLFQTRQKRWPGLSLSADLSVSGLDDLDTGWTGSLLASLTAPLFNASGIAEQIAAARADLDASRFAYRQSVLQAFLEALETLSEQDHQRQLLAVRREELTNNQHLYQLARLRYETGDTDFLNLLTAQRSFFNARDSLIQARLANMLAAIDLYRALGAPPATGDDPLDG